MSTTKSVIISCAGLGSRLGLGTTKALIDIHGKPLIYWQLQLLQDVEDVRIVVGFQAGQVIDAVRKIRNQVVFVYNHNYFETKTGASYYLGAKHGHQSAIELDGDLLVHPQDFARLLTREGEWAAYADKSSDDAVMVNVDESGRVVNFSRTQGDCEWTGPCCLTKNHLQYTSGNVYNLLEPHLPIAGVKVRAHDIDTYNDYQRVLEFVKEW